MAPSRKANSDVSPPNLITQEAQSQTSQDLDTSAMQGLLEKHKKSVKAHTIRGKLEVAVQRDEEQFRARRLPQVERLCELEQKKRQLEEAIISSKTELDTVIETAVKHLQMGIEKWKEVTEG
ncbi:hypothetical protein B0A48_05973 [Cryoendolithus antarcticus]|uniref:Uncharacterized protein n=1 Tax=Cryoendolithus antarcticus TaxID=1507870 RepID=A0A1V8TCZ8_9PEZI|nr:hypothetical protein B0A48_05973 [Cryoendolithus antarcticus]